MRALVDTVSRPPVGSTLEPPGYEITYAGEIRPGSGIGGLLGYYTPPSAGRPGRFWDDGYSMDKSAPYHTTTPEFDAVVARALGTGTGTAAASSASAGVALAHHGGGTAALLAAVFGIGLIAALVVLKAAVARIDRRVSS